MESDVFDVIYLLRKNEQASELLQKANNSFLHHFSKNLSSWHQGQIFPILNFGQTFIR